jgi:hypothetical protein
MTGRLRLIVSRAKMRLATSGPFHNVITFVCLFLLGHSGMSGLFWEDTGDMGMTVYSIDQVRVWRTARIFLIEPSIRACLYPCDQVT